MNTRAYRLHRLRLDLELAESARRAERNRIAREVAERERTAPGIAPIAPSVLAAAFAEQPTLAWALLATLTPTQLVNEAIEYACWIEQQGLEKRWGAILECWERKLAAKRAA